MDRIHSETLRKFRKAIIDDVDVHNGIIKPLTSEYILKDDDVKTILKGKTKEERASILLDLLPRCGPFAFQVFNQALKHHYKWISVWMERDLERSGMSAVDTAVTFNDLPPVPPLPVSREEKVKQFKQELQKLRPGKHLALHGLKGFGKSCLTVMTLKDANLVADLFQNEIYWIKFNYTENKLEKRALILDRKIDDAILIQLNILYHKITKSDLLPMPLKSEPLKECLIRLIKLHFFQKHMNALLILDDVCYKEIVDTFDFGCKVLVITDDLSVVKHKHPTIFKVTDGFTEAESLSLFAKVLDVTVDQLPYQAKKIHRECKGMPLLIAMFTAQFEDFKEQMIQDSSRWQYYLDCLRSKDPRNKALRKKTAIFDMCIEKLQPDLKERYLDLTIFSEEVNIMPKTLEILWGVEPFYVDDLMLILCHKSLAARQWSEQLKCYVYGVHDLLLSHLRSKLTPEIMEQKHCGFIQKYRDVCKDDFSKLPADNYSFSYIGHHLEQAKLFDLFEKVYLDLNFIQAKIIHAGLSDLLIDLTKYNQHITRGSKVLKLKVMDIEKFLKDNMTVLTKHGIRKCLDVVQIALYYAEDGYVLEQARELANKRSLNLYLSRVKKLGEESVKSEENISAESTIDSFTEGVSTICFTDDPQELLIATKNGDIAMKNFEKGKTNYFYGFQKKKITKLVLSNEGNCFLALTDEGVAKLFSLNQDESSDDGKRIQSPREKQKCWTFTGSKSYEDYSLHTFLIDDDVLCDIAFSPQDEFIAGCTSKGNIQVWTKDGIEFQSLTSNNCCLKKITFSSDTQQNMLLHVIDENNCVLITYKFFKNMFEYKSQFNPRIRNRDQNMKIIFLKELPQEKNCLILVTQNKALLIMWCQSPTHDQIHSYEKREKAEIEDSSSYYVAATVTYDGQYLITAKSDGLINVWEIQRGFEPVAVYKEKVSCLDTYWVFDEGYHLFCGNENRLIHKWELKEIKAPKPLTKPMFNALMKPMGQNDIVARQTSKNTIAVFQGSQASWKTVAETDLVEGSVNTMILTPDGFKLIYDVVKEQKQEIIMFNIKTEHATCIATLKKASNFIKVISTLETGIAVIFQENKNSLRVWRERRVAYIVPNTGDVISVHEVDKNIIITVNKDCVKYWDVCKGNWQLLFQTESSQNAISSTIGTGKSYLAVLNETQRDMVLYNIVKDLQSEPSEDLVNVYDMLSEFNDNITCFEFSNDEEYMAIGFEKGDISVFNMIEKMEIRKICFHCSAVSELHWASLSLKTPILLSVNLDELVWWNVSSTMNQHFSRRKSRMGQSLSMQNFASPRSSLRMKNSVSMESKLISSTETNGTNNKTCATNGNGSGPQNTDSTESIATAVEIEFWQSKVSKEETKSALLVVVPLPSNNAKVCVSKDFRKFLTVDNNGYVSTFEPFGLENMIAK